MSSFDPFVSSGECGCRFVFMSNEKYLDQVKIDNHAFYSVTTTSGKAL